MKRAHIGTAIVLAAIFVASAVAAGPKGATGQKTAYNLRLGVCDWTIGKTGDPAAFDLAANLGLDGVQVSLLPKGDSLALADPELRSVFLTAVRKARIPIASFAIGDLNDVPLKSDPRAEQWLAKGIDVAAAMDVKIILVPFFGKGELRNDPAGIDAVVAALKRLAPKAEARGVVLALESYLSAGDNLKILDRVGSPAVQVYYDVGNSQDAGYPILDEIRQLGSHIVEVHAKDTKDLYGKGSMDFPAVVRRSRESATRAGSSWRAPRCRSASKRASAATRTICGWSLAKPGPPLRILRESRPRWSPSYRARRYYLPSSSRRPRQNIHSAH